MFDARKKRLFPGSSDRALANCVSGCVSRSSGGLNDRVKIFCARLRRAYTYISHQYRMATSKAPRSNRQYNM